MTLVQLQTKRLTAILFGVAVLASIGCFVLVVYKWPFTRSAATKALQHEFGREVRIGTFRTTFSPLGYQAENLTFVGDANPASGPELTIRKLVVVASPLDLLLLRKKVRQVLITGLRSSLGTSNATNRRLPGPPRFSEIDLIRLDDTVLKFQTSAPDPNPLTFTVSTAIFTNVSRTRQGSFVADFYTSKPPGAVHISGQIGPWDWRDLGRTSTAGNFVLPHADLQGFAGVEGILNASGRFIGPLDHLVCNGSATVPAFRVSGASHSVDLSTKFSASVNGLNGNTEIDSAESRFNQTVIKTIGVVKEDSAGSGKVALLQLSIENGQIGDLLLLFTHASPPAMAGTVDLRLEVEVPPGPTDFLRKLSLKGQFGIGRGHFANARLQVPLNHLSESAAGMERTAREENHKTVLSGVTGLLSTQRGIATLSHIAFAVPGAHGVLSGTYNLLNQSVNLEGQLLTSGQMSSTTSGLKALMWRIITPLMKKDSVTVVPFMITGTAQHPTLSLNLLNRHHS